MPRDKRMVKNLEIASLSNLDDLVQVESFDYERLTPTLRHYTVNYQKYRRKKCRSKIPARRPERTQHVAVRQIHRKPNRCSFLQHQLQHGASLWEKTMFSP